MYTVVAAGMNRQVELEFLGTFPSPVLGHCCGCRPKKPCLPENKPRPQQFHQQCQDSLQCSQVRMKHYRTMHRRDRPTQTQISKMNNSNSDSPATRRPPSTQWSQTRATRVLSICSQRSASLQKTSKWSCSFDSIQEIMFSGNSPTSWVHHHGRNSGLWTFLFSWIKIFSLCIL